MAIRELVLDDTVQKVGIGVLSVIGTWLFEKWRNKSTTLIYSSAVELVGATTTDPVFGAIEVRWAQQAVPNLYMATIHLSNPSLKDIENLKLVAYVSIGGRIVSDKSIIEGSVHPLPYDVDFMRALEVPNGQQPTDYQLFQARSRREYLVGVLNRNERLTFTFLLVNDQASAGPIQPPMVWMEARKAGVRTVQRPHLTTSFGVQTGTALKLGVALTLGTILSCVALHLNIWIVGFASAFVGLGAQSFGAAAYRGYCYIKGLLAG